MIYWLYQDLTWDTWSNIALFPWDFYLALTLGTPSGKGLCLISIYLLSRPYMDKVHCNQILHQVHTQRNTNFSFMAICDLLRFYTICCGGNFMTNSKQVFKCLDSPVQIFFLLDWVSTNWTDNNAKWPVKASVGLYITFHAQY